MKLIYITGSLPYDGAGEEFFLPEIKELLRLGHALTLVPRSLNGIVEEEESKRLLNSTAGEPLISLHVLAGAFLETLRSPLKTFQAFFLLFKTRSPKTFFLNLAVFPKGVWTARLARKSHADHIHAQWLSTTGTIGLIASKISGIPWSFTAHRGDVVRNNLLKEKIESVAFGRFIAASSMALARKHGAPIDNPKIHVMHMGVTLPQASAEIYETPVPPVILCPARFLAVKGHRFLIEAIGKLRDRGIDCTLELAGKGELQEILEKQVRELGLGDRVQFRGWISRTDLLERYRARQVSITCLASLDLGDGLHEGIPVSLIEAMANCVPVVATRTGGIHELVSDDAGILVPHQDSEALAQAFQFLIQQPEKAKALALAGRKRVEEQFGAERIASQLTTLMRTATSSGNIVQGREVGRG